MKRTAVSAEDQAMFLEAVRDAKPLTARDRLVVPPAPPAPVRVAVLPPEVKLTVEGDGPHGGERHPDGDEILYVISGELILEADAMDKSVHVPAGRACIIRRGEWHTVTSKVPTQMVHITPGPRGDARPQ